jgi:hypothetical protein
MAWSAAEEKTLSKWYVLLLSALGPIESSRLLPFTPSVDKTTPLFSLTSRSLRPLHRTTTLIFVSPPSSSKSRSFRFVPLCVVAIEATESAGDTAPDLSRGGIIDLTDEGRGNGGGRMLARILFFLAGIATAGRGKLPAI